MARLTKANFKVVMEDNAGAAANFHNSQASEFIMID